MIGCLKLMIVNGVVALLRHLLSDFQVVCPLCADFEEACCLKNRTEEKKLEGQQ